MWLSWSRQLAGWQARLPRVVAVVRVVYLPLALLLVGYIGFRAAQKVELSTIRVGPLVGAYSLALVWWLTLACGWSTLLTERVAVAPVRAWCQTQVMRYLPGGIWAPVARAATVRGRVRDKAAAVLAENVTVFAAAIGVAALWVTVHSPYWLPLAAVIAVPTIGARWLERRTKVARTAVVRTTGVYVVGYVVYGLAAILTQVAVSGVRHPTYPLYVAGAACVAWAIGLVVVFAPGGVGVREVVYVWMLRGLYPRAELQVAAVTSRLVTVLAELTVLAALSAPQWRRRNVPVSTVSKTVDTIAAQAGGPGDVSEGQASEGPDSRW
jgi:hypothetical protein